MDINLYIIIITLIFWSGVIIYTFSKFLLCTNNHILFKTFYGSISFFSIHFLLTQIYSLIVLLRENSSSLLEYVDFINLHSFSVINTMYDVLLLLFTFGLLVSGVIQKYAKTMMSNEIKNKVLAMEAENQRRDTLKQNNIIELYDSINKIKNMLSSTKSIDFIYKESLKLLSESGHYDVMFFGFFKDSKLDVKFFRDSALMPFISNDTDIRYNENFTRENNPAIEVIESPNVIVIEDATKDIRLKNFHSQIKFSGIKSSISLPLRMSVYHSPIASLTLFSTQSIVEDSNEVGILKEIVELITARILLIESEEKREVQEIELMQQNALLEKIIETVPARIFWKDTNLVYQGCNSSFASDAETSVDNVVNKTDKELIWKDNADEYSADDNFVIDNNKNVINRVEKQGERWILTNKAPFKDDSGKTIGVVGVYIDVTLQKQAEDYLKENEKRFRELLELIPNVAINGCNAALEILYWNKQCETLYGYSKEEVLGKRIDEILYKDTKLNSFSKGIKAWISSNITLESNDQIIKSKDGNTLEVNSSHVLLNRLSSYPEIFNIDIDVTSERKSKRKLIQAANFDNLTQLPNRFNLEKYIKKIFDLKDRPKFAMFFMDIDNFKNINDSYGHSVGDMLLVEVSKRLNSFIDKNEIVARFGGDEFIMMLTYKDKNDIALKSKKLVKLMRETFLLGNSEFYITMSIGITFLDTQVDSYKKLLQQADSAMYSAKDNGKNVVNFFTDSMTKEVTKKVKVEQLLREAIKNNLLQLYYQPQVSIKTGKLESCEALIRWKDSNSGQFIPPDIFIPIAFQAHLMDDISRFVIDDTLKTLSIWQDSQYKDIKIYVNLPSNQLQNVTMVNYILRGLEKYKVKPENFGIEITEDQIVKLNDKKTLEHIQALKKIGVTLSIDDFGTGYSSLQYLMSLEIDTIKIDRDFILNLDTDHNQILVKSIIAMTQALGYNVVAEGVETQVQKEFLIEHNCNQAQGYGYHKPMPKDEFQKLLVHK